MENKITTSIISEAPVRDEIITQSQEAYTEEELYDYFFMSERNKLQKDGRINGGYDKNGLLVAYSISPKFDKFDTQVEDGVYPIVKALVDKGYFSICSCEGHPRRLNVKLGFGTELCRDEFIKTINSYNIPFLYLRPHESCANIKSDISTKNIDTEQFGYEEETDIVIKENAKCFNYQFKKNFKQWFFLDINMFDPDTRNPFKRWKINKAIQSKKNHTNKLRDAILDKSFPHYQATYKASRKILRNQGIEWEHKIWTKHTPLRKNK